MYHLFSFSHPFPPSPNPLTNRLAHSPNPGKSFAMFPSLPRCHQSPLEWIRASRQSATFSILILTENKSSSVLDPFPSQTVNLSSRSDITLHIHKTSTQPNSTATGNAKLTSQQTLRRIALSPCPKRCYKAFEHGYSKSSLRTIAKSSCRSCNRHKRLSFHSPLIYHSHTTTDDTKLPTFPQSLALRYSVRC